MMRYCPHCQQIYNDDTMIFCLEDGTPLAVRSDPAQETVIISSPVTSPGQQVAKPGVNPIFAYLSIALVALVAGGGLVLWIKNEGNASSRASNKLVAEAPPSNEQSKSVLNSQSNTPRPEQGRSPDVQKNTSAPTAPSLPRSSNGTWFVVLGSYSKNDPGKADQRLSYVRGLGHDASLVDSDNYPGFKGGLFCVVAGPFSKADAKGQLGRMKSSVPDAYIKSGW